MEAAISGCVTAFFGGLFTILANCVCVCHCNTCCDCFFTTCKRDAEQMVQSEQRREAARAERRREEALRSEKPKLEIENI